MVDVRGYCLGPHQCTTPAAVTTNKKNGFSKSSENIQNKKGVPDSSVSNNQFRSVTLNELAKNAKERESIL